ncbi:MAG TPA: transglycosylase SLT domain-containing protein [Mycobacteriales bacterium]|nr:transglycosylase SLT domain-containing protein [Mycobacteriales bacterium]
MAGALVGPALADGTAGDKGRREMPVAMSVTDQRAVMDWTLPDAGYLADVHKVRHHHATASRSTARAPLTTTADPQSIAHAMLLRQGYSEGEWSCLQALWTRESGWNTYASNASSGAYGIPQALPAEKMATFGADYRTNPITQISWGLWYIHESYGSPCGALSHENSYGYY